MSSKSDGSIYKEAATRGLKTISFSQFSLFSQCPLSWYRQYVEKIKFDSKGMDMLFGTAFHETLQEYLSIYFNQTIVAANAFDCDKFLNDAMLAEFKKMSKDGDTSFTDKDTMRSYFIDGVEILKFVKKNIRNYFDKSKYDLFGIEVPILVPVSEGSKIAIVGFLDIVLKEKESNRYLIIDIKTSYMGWKKNKKEDTLTKGQLLLYKKYFAIQQGISEKEVDIKFFVVKRKIFVNEAAEFTPGRVQQIAPASGAPTMKKFFETFQKFIYIFNEDGKVKDGLVFNKAATKKACTYCNLLHTQYCDRK